MSRTAEYDIVVIGAGAAGIGAARLLAQSGRSFVVLEARERIGGRAWSKDSGRGFPIDLGCEWMHSATTNPLVPLARELGIEVDEYGEYWAAKWNEAKLGPEAYARFRGAIAALFEKAEALAAAGGPDVALGDLLPADEPWRPSIEAICGWMTGARLDQVSAIDLGCNNETPVNWRLPIGYGGLIEAMGQGLPILLSTPVDSVDWRDGPIAVGTKRGTVKARKVIVTVPSSLIADETIHFAPALPDDKLAAAANLPLGADLKLFLAVESTPFGPPQDRQIHSRHDRVESVHMHLHPFGRPVVMAYFGGDLARDLETQGIAAIADFAERELAFAFGEDVRGHFEPLAASTWMADPWCRGAYSFARPGASDARAILARPLQERIFFAGEATSSKDFSTAHGAYVSGLAAAEAALAAFGTAPALAPKDALR